MNKRLFLQNLFLFLVPLLIPLIIMGSLSIWILERYVSQDIDKSNANLLRQSRDAIELMLSELDSLRLGMFENAETYNELVTILNEPELTYETGSSMKLINGFLNALTSAKAYVDAVYIYIPNGNGRFLSSIDGIENIASVEDNDWFDHYREYAAAGKEEMWTEIREMKQYEGESTPVRTVTLYQKIAPYGGVIVLNIKPRYVEDMLSSLELDPEQEIFILDRNEKVIFANRPSVSLNDQDLNRISRSSNSFSHMEAAGIQAIVSKLESNRYGWQYISVVPEHSLYRIPRMLKQLSLLLLGVSFSFGLLLTFYLTRKTIVKKYIENKYMQSQLSEKKYKLQWMEMLALQSQMNPHFLYNTLNGIYWEALGLTGKPNKASDMVENLSDILDYSLSRPNQAVTIQEEMEHTRRYIEIMKSRYNNRFDVIWEVDDTVLSTEIPRLLLQPLVENSIYHGIKEKEGMGLIKIRIVEKQGFVEAAVIDNGLGIPPERLSELRRNLSGALEEMTGHIGLLNTNRRLQLICGEKSGLTIMSKPGTGTVVRFSLQQLAGVNSNN
jgi:Predicted signal transduction protein with a C-terminal ATPase domain